MSQQLVALVNSFHAFEQENPQGEIADFCRYYLAKQDLEATPQLNSPHQHIPLDGRLGKILGRLSRFSIHYAKRKLAEIHLQNVEDFGYLATLHDLGTPKKSELITAMLSDFTTGIEVIKRLQKLGFVEEFPDEHDKRSKRLAITPEGEETLRHSYPIMQGVGRSVFSVLSADEKAILLQLVEKLDRYHTEMYVKGR